VAEQKVRIKDMKKGAEYEVEMGGIAGFFPG
jgi:hypothetical protein